MYLDDFLVRSTNCQLIIVITYNKYIFSTNNRKTHELQYKKDIYLYLKEKGRRIIGFHFPLSFSRLYSFCFFEKKQDQIIKYCDLLSKEGIEILEYRKNNKGY